ncbi:MAG: glutamate 5-kinase [Deltaproteobacteria bacterium]|nr:MAG: glutamate 5-kinase [Deltaproteobacteria bacterium]
MNLNRQHYITAAKRIVVKVGSNVLTRTDGLNIHVVRSISRQICQLRDRGGEVVLVTSGAMAVGLKKIDLSARPADTPGRQAVAAVGQAGLMMEYEHAFDRYGIKVAQVLLTSDDLNDRKRYLNVRNTLHTLLGWNVIPVINENDSVKVESIQFGDNDNLAAMISLLMDADLYINLTDIDGLYTRDPRRHKNAELIPVVQSIDEKIKSIAGRIPGDLGTGGMQTKIKAAEKVAAVGTPMIIADGTREDTLIRLLDGDELGTFFVPRRKRLARRKCWIGYSVRPEGVLRLDTGAADAIAARGKSLLPSGITGVEGDFGIGAPVECRGPDNAAIGVGLVNYRARDIRQIMGLQTRQIATILNDPPYDEVIHRNNLTITLTEE